VRYVGSPLSRLFFLGMFSGYYKHLDVDSVDAKGRETVVDCEVERRWSIYRECETSRAEKRECAACVVEGDVSSSNYSERIEDVVRALGDARSDLDVIIGVISELEEQQQHLSITHVPQSIAQEVEREHVVAMKRKKRQLLSISERLGRGAETLRLCPRR
jgi:hypothetical protein